VYERGRTGTNTPTMSGRPGTDSTLSPRNRRRPPTRLVSLGKSGQRLPGPSSGVSNRRASVSGLTAAPKTQRTSKTTQKLVVLPSAPQTRPLAPTDEEDLTLGVEADGGVREYKSEAERMTKEQRKEAGFKRLTAYCVAESFQMKLLTPFLKREHNVAPRIFDEALYAVCFSTSFSPLRLYLCHVDVSSASSSRLRSKCKHPFLSACSCRFVPDRSRRRWLPRNLFHSTNTQIVCRYEGWLHLYVSCSYAQQSGCCCLPSLREWFI